MLTLSACTQPTKPPERTEEIIDKVNWRHEWNKSIFEDAKTQNKPILLSLEAVWCHWCHVMKAETYADDEVAQILNDKYIAISIDQDSNAYLSSRYKKYGWPATIIFNSKGEEVLKQAGYIEKDQMLDLLNKILLDPRPQADYSRSITYSQQSSLAPALKEELITNFFKSLDLKLGGLKSNKKYLERDTVEYAIISSKLASTEAANKKICADFVKLTLKKVLALLDPAWGGFYQYSTFKSWNHPHYEKLTERQAEYIRVYALAYRCWQDKLYRDAITKTINYIDKFLTDPNGGFYSSQDADLVQGKKGTDYFQLADAARRRLGIPRVDKNIYASKNGIVINALAQAYASLGDTKILVRAIKAAKFICSKLQNSDHSFRHSNKDSSSYLADNLYMAEALLSLYTVTAERGWLTKSDQVAEFITQHYKSSNPGYLSFAADAAQDAGLEPIPELDENIRLARLLNLLHHYTGKAIYKDEAREIMKYLASEDVALASSTEPGILIVDKELNEDPVHFTIVGSKSDAKAKALHREALKYPSSYLRVEWYDKQEGKLMNHDVEYPELSRAAAFSCKDHSCSLPIYEVKEVLVE